MVTEAKELSEYNDWQDVQTTIETGINTAASKPLIINRLHRPGENKKTDILLTGINPKASEQQ